MTEAPLGLPRCTGDSVSDGCHFNFRLEMPGAFEVWLVVSPAGTTAHPSVEGKTISNSTSGPQVLVRKRVCHWRAASLSF